MQVQNAFQVSSSSDDEEGSFHHYVEDYDSTLPPVKLLPEFAQYMQVGITLPNSNQQTRYQKLCILGMQLCVAAFQVFTKEYINLSGIAYNFWKDQYNLNDMLTNQIIYHCAQVLGFFVALCLSD